MMKLLVGCPVTILVKILHVLIVNPSHISDS